MTDADARNLAIVVPVHNEAAVLGAFHARLAAVLDGLDATATVLYVDDGSTDTSAEVIDRLSRDDPRVGLLALSRNFGKEAAITAGLDHATGDAVIVLDADLQDPPELIPELVARWRAGFDVVYGQRTDRRADTWLKRTTADLFYRLMQRTGRVRIPSQAGDYRLLSRRAVDAIVSLREHHRFMKGLYAWVGYPQAAVPYTREARAGGESKWTYWGLWNLALEGITSFTAAPLKIASYIGLATAGGAFVYGLVIIARTLIMGRDVPGYASIMVVVLFLGGIQLMALGAIGEYLGRTFNEVKRRPLYFVDTFDPGRGARQRSRAPLAAVEGAGQARGKPGPDRTGRRERASR
jgi:glycosyltransferase involved in cell wall biosynthesis